MKLKTGIAIFLLFLFAKTVPAAEPYNYAESWRSWNVVAREAAALSMVSPKHML
jgi:hypothetical protein